MAGSRFRGITTLRFGCWRGGWPHPHRLEHFLDLGGWVFLRVPRCCAERKMVPCSRLESGGPHPRWSCAQSAQRGATFRTSGILHRSRRRCPTRKLVPSLHKTRPRSENGHSIAYCLSTGSRTRGSPIADGYQRSFARLMRGHLLGR